MRRGARRGRIAERRAPPAASTADVRAAGMDEAAAPRLGASLSALPAEAAAGRRPGAGGLEAPAAPVRLSVGAGDSAAERQADRIASRVLGRPDAAGGRSGADAGRDAASAPPGFAGTLAHAGPGAPLPAPVRERIEPVLGHSLSRLRLHDDTGAQAAARQIGARAFTRGDHVWLGAGESAHDAALMAHEASHAVQQQASAGAQGGLIQRQQLPPEALDSEILGPVYPSPAEWQDRALQQAGIDAGQWLPERGFPHNRPIIERVYAYYQRLHVRDPDLLWAGMAKLAGGEVLRGLRQAQDMIDAARLMREHANWAEPGERAAVASMDLQAGYAATLQRRLILMQKHIFEDLAWQHQAYVEGGLSALEYAHAGGSSVPIGAWRNIASGNAARVRAGNRALLRREQEEVLRDDYRYIRDIPDFDAIPAMMSGLAQSPVPGGRPFRQVVPGGDITAFPDRWRWIEGDMLPAYEGLTPERRRQLVETSLDDLSRRRFPPPRRPGGGR